MNTKLFKSILLVAGLVTAGFCSAGLITDVEKIDTKLSTWQSTSWTHNLLEPGDDHFELGSAISGDLSIQFADDEDRGFELATIVVGKVDFQDGKFFYIPNQDWTGGLGINSLASLNTTGTLDVTIWSSWGDFYIGDAFLSLVTSDVVGDDNTVAVAEPSSLVLLGLGLVGLGFCRRRAKA